MARNLFDEAKVHPAIRSKIAGYKQKLVQQVQAAIAAHDVVVVGMRQNPFPKKVRKALDAAGVRYHYMEYGSYFSMWRERMALKIWTGWPTFPMVFVKGMLVGGYNDVQALITSGELQKLLA